MLRTAVSAQIVNNDADQSGIPARGLPGLSKIADRFALIVEHEPTMRKSFLSKARWIISRSSPLKGSGRPSLFLLTDEDRALGPSQVNVARFKREHLAYLPLGHPASLLSTNLNNLSKMNW
jgi:hypothetical protein